MEPFLLHTAKFLYKNRKDDLSEICVVLPTKRAAMFLKKHFAELISQPIWLPQIISIEEFMVSLSGHQIIDPITLLFELYNIHQNLEKESARPFSEFDGWGQLLLHDFNEIDLYLIDSGKIYSYLSEAKAIEKWNLNLKPLSDFEKNYLRFYQSIKEYYNLLNQYLEANNLAYQGLAYKKAYQNIESKTEIPWKHIYFCGLNALTTSEEKIIQTLKERNLATYLWDADKYYLNDDFQEAGKFLRNHLKKENPESVKWIFEDFKSYPKDIKIIGIPQNIGQVKKCGEIIAELLESKVDIHKVAIVLADENLLIPLLNSIPSEIKDFNVTMGLPLRSTPLFDLFDILLRTFINRERIHVRSNLTVVYFTKDILEFFQHSYINKIKSFDIKGFLHSIRSKNKAIIKPDDIYSAVPAENEEFRKFLKFIYDIELQAPALINAISFLSEKLKESFIEDQVLINNSHKLETEYLFCFNEIIQKLQKLISEYPFVSDIKTLKKLFDSITQSTTIPFYGEPLKGLQIMGVLETRTLDFEMVILLSTNEGILPASRSNNSFIPFDIKREFGLPTFKDKEAVYSYHFYRLLQRTQNAHILYNTESNEFGGGEKSRFIKQIQHELAEYNHNIKITEEIQSIHGLTLNQDNGIEISKSEEIINKIIEKAKSGFSASSLNNYIQCSLLFYFSEIANLKKPEEPDATIDAATMGKVVHHSLQELYKPYLLKPLTGDNLEQMMLKSDEIVTQSFIKIHKDGDISHGKNLLIVKVAQSFIRNFLKFETKEINQLQKESTYLTILKNEYFASHNLNISIIAHEIKLIGFIDRVDQIGGTLRIIDYKTGNIQSNELKLTDWDGLLHSRKAKLFQVLFYAWLYQQEFPSSKDMSAGLLSFRKLKSGFIPTNILDSPIISSSVIDAFEEKLKNLISNIFNIEIPFSQTPEISNCKYCSFIDVCKRS